MPQRVVIPEHHVPRLVAVRQHELIMRPDLGALGRIYRRQHGFDLIGGCASVLRISDRMTRRTPLSRQNRPKTMSKSGRKALLNEEVVQKVDEKWPQ